MLLSRTFLAAMGSMLLAALLWLPTAKQQQLSTIPDRSTMTVYPGP